jgi:Fe-S-cluster-containing dehydrogenase component
MTVGTVGAGALAPAAAQATATPATEFRGMLVDTTRCIGCRECEAACAAAKGLPAPDLGPAARENIRSTGPSALTVVNRQATDGGYMFVKDQCMHCNQPACASACLTKALLKTEEGPVIWRASKCMGCRMCMVSCPFGVPKFEYDSANPKIVKCDLCWERLEAGGKPACVEACPAGALTFGTRRELLRTARERIHREPDRYVDHIYGEHEAGGTGVLYLASVPFEQLAMDTTLGDVPYPELAKPFLSSVPVVLILFPALMLALARSRAEQVAEREEPR